MKISAALVKSLVRSGQVWFSRASGMVRTLSSKPISRTMRSMISRVRVPSTASLSSCARTL